MILILLLWLHTAAAATNAELVRKWFETQPIRWLGTVLTCRTIVLLFTDQHWADLTAELMVELEQFGNYQRCVVLWYWKSSNQTMFEDQTAVTIPIYVDERSATVSSAATGGGSDWGSAQYFDKIAQRVPIAYEILKVLASPLSGLAVVDSDIALFRNVLRRMELENVPLVIQQETQCPHRHGSICVNGGFWRVQGGEHGEKILHDVVDVMQKLNIPDQDAFDVVLNRRAHIDKVAYLDRLQYANCDTYLNDAHWRQNASHIVHVNCNWLAGGIATKRTMLRKLRGRAPLTIESLLNEK